MSVLYEGDVGMDDCVLEKTSGFVMSFIGYIKFEWSVAISWVNCSKPETVA